MSGGLRVPALVGGLNSLLAGGRPRCRTSALTARRPSLHHLGYEEGTGAAVWARVVRDELARHEEARDLLRDGSGHETWERLFGTVFLVVIAIRQVVVFGERVSAITGDAKLAEARKRFHAFGPSAKALRDLVIHLDEYAVGQGRRQRKGAKAPIAKTNIAATVYWYSDSEDRPLQTVLTLGGEQLDLHVAADAAVELAEVVERVRRRHLECAGKEADAAWRRRAALRALAAV